MALKYSLARKRRRWLERTQADVAEELGVDVTTLSRWESGERAPTVEQLVSWARALGLRPVELDPDVAELARELLAGADAMDGAGQVGVGEADAPPVPSRSGAGNFPGTPATPPQSEAEAPRRSA